MFCKTFFGAVLFAGCGAGNSPYDGQQRPQLLGAVVDSPLTEPMLLPRDHPSGEVIATRILAPHGFARTSAEPNSFTDYLRRLPLKPHGSLVLLYDGSEKRNQSAHAAVLTLDAGTRDLQQCADAVMRLRAEYLFEQRRLNDIHFNFTSGFRADFSRWARGERIRVIGNGAKWVQVAPADASHKSLRQFLDVVYSYAGTRSLEKELVPVSIEDVQAGDVFIRGGSPGHAVIVLDVAQNGSGETVFLLAQSYMPAQDIHVLVNRTNPTLSPWYAVSEIGEVLKTPEWEFRAHELKRFRGE